MSRPLWAEGTLLCPQHMQQQDRYHEHQLAARLAVVTAHAWGILAVRFDLAALQTGQLALTYLRAVFPDGAAVDLDETSHLRPATRPIAPHFPKDLARVRVYLTAAALRPGASNSAREPGVQHRYRTVTRAIFDLTLSRSARDIDLDELHLALKLGDESRDDQVSLPLAELVRDSSGGYALDDTYIPPIAMLAAAPSLRAELQTLCALVSTRRRALAEDRRRQQELPRALFFHTLSGALPLLRHLADAPECAPHSLYRDLLRLLGELRSFTTDELPEPPRYDFTDLRASLAPLLAELRHHILDTLPDRCLRIALEPRPDGLWIGELHDDRLQRGSTFVLAVETDADPRLLANELPALTRIAAWRRINAIVRQNILGAPIRHTLHPPVELPVLPHHSYFIIAADDPSWLEVLRERNVAVFLPRPYDPDHVRISLLAIPGPGA